MSKLSRWLRGDKPRAEKAEKFPLGYSDEDKPIWEEAKPFTMTDKEKVLALIHAARYVARADVAGDIVECGVWKGGSMMAVARTLLSAGVTDRDLYLFDTYEGMTQPGAQDVNHKGYQAREVFEEQKFEGREGSDWCYADVDEVRRNVSAVGYPENRLHFIKGKVEDTLPGGAPERIALLRLDTDWYESTLHEMNTLYPRLSPGGVLIVDDYFTWRGSKQAVDEYFSAHGIHALTTPVSGGVVILNPGA